MAIDPLPAMPVQERQRSDEAIRRILPELIKIQRYEARRGGSTGLAIRAICEKAQAPIRSDPERRCACLKSRFDRPASGSSSI
jgi:hypothetical protein